MKGFLKNILWPTDFSAEAQEALHYAAAFAKTFSSRITALHVAPDFTPALYDDALLIQRELQTRSESLKKSARAKIQSSGRKKGISFADVILTEGSASKKIIETAEKEQADLIVMGRRGQSALEKLFIGSVANHVLRHSPVPVLITRKSRRRFPVRKILVPTDFAKEEETEQEYAWNLAKGFKASLTFLYVLELFGHEFRMVDDMFKTVHEKFMRREKKERKGIPIFEEVTKATHAASGIVDYAKENRFDLIVMATCAKRLGRFFLGSTTEKVISSTDLPVFAMPPKLC